MPIRASRFTEEQIGFALNQAETGTPVFSVLRNRSESLRRASACRVKPCKCWCCCGSLYRWLGRFTKVSTDGGASEPAYDFFSLASSAETQRIKELGLVKPYLSQDPRLITLSCRHLVTNFLPCGFAFRARGEFSARGKFKRPYYRPMLHPDRDTWVAYDLLVGRHQVPRLRVRGGG